MIRSDRALTDGQARVLLRGLRDLNLCSGHIDLGASRAVAVQGCASSDAPVEQGVRYRLRDPQGEPEMVTMAWTDGRLTFELSAGWQPDAPVTRSLAVEVRRGVDGRLVAPALGARLNLTRLDACELEHLMRRIVRVVCADS
ncbi:MAG: hypothetical protein QF903_01480 [Planctomycetota bacterium]|jgi:hypothetical protein|nr:hypothetical protein [Planctomycetota bacterium]MDP6762265.1 hypothetical protein [Planctomycetota bacterium]MDP6988134.1 hypothetical protein [Planctomycetota bacterium]